MVVNVAELSPGFLRQIVIDSGRSFPPIPFQKASINEQQIVVPETLPIIGTEAFNITNKNVEEAVKKTQIAKDYYFSLLKSTDIFEKRRAQKYLPQTIADARFFQMHSPEEIVKELRIVFDEIKKMASRGFDEAEITFYMLQAHPDITHCYHVINHQQWGEQIFQVMKVLESMGILI